MNYSIILPILTLVMGKIDTIQFQRPCQDLSEECLTKSLQMAWPSFVHGLPELGVQSLDPYTIDRLDLMLPGGLAVQFTQGVARGLKNCDIDFVRLDGDTVETQLHCNLTVNGKYKSLGRLLMFQIDGHGDASIKCRNLRLHTVFKLSSNVAPDGKKYVEIVASNTDHSFDGRVSYSMTNLFRENPELSNTLVNFINDSWLMVAEEFGGPLVEYGVSAVLKNLKLILTKIPMNAIITEPLNL